MVSSEILQKIRHIEISTKRILSGSLVGDYGSALKGFGFEFDQIREYQLGDDIRFIDWKNSAKSNKILVKQYLEERNRTILLFVDVSASVFWGSQENLKYEVMAQISSILSLAAVYGKDRVGLVFFSDIIEKKILPGKGLSHAFNLMKELFSFVPKGYKTNLDLPFSYLASLKAKDVIAFIISDLIGNLKEKIVRLASKRHDVVLIRCTDINEVVFPGGVGIEVSDLESTSKSFVGGNNLQKAEVQKFLSSRLRSQELIFKKCGVDFVHIISNRPFIGDLVKFFRRRMMYSST